MKKNYLLITIMFFVIRISLAQTTETFETETGGASSFSEGGLVFNITSQQQGPFLIQDDYPGTGWGGSGIDNRYIDNDGEAAFNQPVQFTIATAGGTDFRLASMYLFLSTHALDLNVSGTLTITGMRDGVVQFTASTSSGFNNGYASNNGFTFINMATFGGQNNTSVNIDQFIISTTSGINYVALDGLTWNCAGVTVSQASQTNVSCNGGNDGTATVSASGGSGFTYNWTPGNPAGDGTATATGLTAGNWTCTVTNSCGSSSSTTFTITQPAALSASQSQTNVGCPGTNTGSASVSPSGGTAPYTYSWSPSGGTGSMATGLAAGDYTVTITDSNGCSIIRNFTILENTSFTAATSQTNIICSGTSTGSASVSSVSGGTAPYTYSWSPSGGTAPTASNLAAGNYTVTITDANGCQIQRSVTITTAADCSVATTWNGSSWSNGTPTCNAYAATINGNYDSAVNGEITACTLVVNSGAVSVAGGDNFVIKGAVSVNGGSLTFGQNSNLVQSDDVDNAGTITYNRNSSALYNLDYTLWSSPVTGTQTLKDFSPNTLDERFYVYNTALNAYSNYLSASGIFGGNPDSETFDVAKGYLIRMPDGISDDTPTVFNGSFTGTPNNGDISIALSTAGNRYNAVGNPYPSPINIQAFLTHNQTSLDNGTLYFWRKRNATTGTAYATVTMAAYVAATAEGGDTSGGAFNDGDEAHWVINPAQGFFVKAATTATNLEFNNSMRRSVNNGQFFRINGQQTPPEPFTASKLWLDVTGENGDFGQMALAYTNVTTNGLDYGYDGRLFNDGALAIYSLAEDTRLAIQAREEFTVQDEVLVGYSADAAGTYIVNLSKLTGVFEQGQDVYLKDNHLGTEHNLTNSPYTFTTDAGIFNGRFSIIYTTALGTDSHYHADNTVKVVKNGNTVSVISAETEIVCINIFDIRGRIVYEQGNINSQTVEIQGLNIEKQVLIVQVETAGGIKAIKKIIF